MSCLGGQQQINNELFWAHCAHIWPSWKQMEKQRCDFVSVSMLEMCDCRTSAGHSQLFRKTNVCYAWISILMCCFVFVFAYQWMLWGLERSTEDYICPAGGPVLRQLDWLWQSLGRSTERLDQPCDQQVRPGSVLTVKSSQWAHTHSNTAAISACLMLLTVQHGSAQRAVLVPSRGLCDNSNQHCTDQLSQYLSRASATRALLACVHFNEVKPRW